MAGSKFKHTTRLHFTAFYTNLSEAVVADVQELTWTVCPIAYLERVQNHETCPSNDVSYVAYILILLLFLISGVLICCPGAPVIWLPNSYHEVDLKLVFAYWFFQFWAAVSASLIVRKTFFDLDTQEKMGYSFFYMMMFWDAGLMILRIPEKRCAQRDRCLAQRRVPMLFAAAVCCCGTFWGTIATLSAYTPSHIAIIGHHCLVWGALNFALGLVEKVARVQVQRRIHGLVQWLTGTTGPCLRYRPFISEITNAIPKRDCLTGNEALLKTDA